MNLEHVHDRSDSPTISLPHISKSGLSADIPQLRGERERMISHEANGWPGSPKQAHYLDRYVAFGDLFHVETDGRYHVVGELSRGDHVHKCGLAGVLQADQSELELLLPEQAFDPV